MTMTYDQHTYDLAQYFVKDLNLLPQQADQAAHQLAQAIQAAIEDWLALDHVSQEGEVR